VNVLNSLYYFYLFVEIIEISVYQLLYTHTYEVKHVVWIHFLVLTEIVRDLERCKQEFSERT
jgi:hypothetical protein